MLQFKFLCGGLSSSESVSVLRGIILEQKEILANGLMLIALIVCFDSFGVELSTLL